MAFVGLGVFYGGVITGIPVVTGVAEGVSHQKKQNEEANNETRMVKFHLDVFCAAKSPKSEGVDGGIVIVKNDKVWVVPQDPETKQPLPLAEGAPPPHPFTGFYIQYPDEDRSPPERGLVSTISLDPPMLNWIYCDKDTLEVKYSNRTGSIQHVVGPWDWTEDETGITLEGWEGFVAVEEYEEGEEPEGFEGLRWALYFDRWDDQMKMGKRVGGKTVLPCSLERRVFSTDQQQKEQEEADRKLQVKSTGDLKSKLSLREA